jgi:FkbM family methyltransferase
MKITKEGIAVLENDTHISKWVEESGRLDHDQNMLPLVLQYIKPGDTVVDCGAFIGDHTIAYLNKVGVKGFVYAFEANTEAWECLMCNLKEYRNCLLINRVVGEDSASYQVHVNPNAGASIISTGEAIQGCTIDDLSLSHCDFIKFDIEGFELKALKGALKTITHFHPALLIEINEGALALQKTLPYDIFEFMSGRDYVIRNIYPEQKMEGPQYDIICIHKTKM